MKPALSSLVHSAGVVGLIALSVLLSALPHQFSSETAAHIQLGIGVLGATAFGHTILAAVQAWRQNASAVAVTASPAQSELGALVGQLGADAVKEVLAFAKAKLSAAASPPVSSAAPPAGSSVKS